MRSFFRICLVFAVALIASVGALHAQGVTTAALRGHVADDQGNMVAGAGLTLTNTTTGQALRSQSRADGRYNFENVPVGGPYRLEVRMIGYRPVNRDGIMLALGQVLDLNIAMTRAAVELETISITAAQREDLFGSSVQGTSTTITDSALRRLPTLDRQFTDFVRLTPQIAEREAGGVSAAGQNNRFNTIQVDGSTVNDRFGLGSTGLTGGQAQGRAVGLEAVQQYQVLLAPYDVRQGNFTGALINAVTKNGTNTLSGSAFYYFRNQGLAGDPLGETDFERHQFGASLGGPLVQDRLHFFLNGEVRRASSPARGPFIGASDPVKASQADIDAFNTDLAGYGLPSNGVGTLVTNQNPLVNLLARMDYQLGSRSRLTFRYILNTAQDDIFSRGTGSTYDLSTVAYQFTNSTHNPSIQLITNFEGGASNEFLLSWNRIRDRRAPVVTTPLIIVQNFTAADGSGSYSLQSGSERFSQGNELDQDIFELTNNYTFPMGSHRITIGTRNELYRVRNLFAQGSYGVWTFDDIDDFTNGVVEQYEGAGDLGQGIAARFSAGIFGAYIQDQFQLTPRLSLTAGLRLDVPMFFDQPTYEQRVIDGGYASDVPSGQLMLSPRLGFNFDPSGDRATQFRGGIGLFTGTPAYVWYSNAYSNNGTKIGRITCTGANVPVFEATLGGPLACADGTGLSAGTTLGEVNTVASDTRFPQVLRANLAVDRRLPGDVVGTLEFIVTKGINDFFIVNRNLPETAVGTDANGRTMYGTINANGTVTPAYVDLPLYGPSFNGGLYELRNTSNNRSWSLTTQVQKRFTTHWEANVSYSYSDAKDVQSFNSSRAISNWRFGRVYAGDQFVDDAQTSNFHRPHRLVAGVTYTFPWRSLPTDLSINYVGQSGQPYTLIAGGSSGRGDLNADGTNTNDPIYIPNDATTEMVFRNITDGATAAEQAAAFNDYIAGEPCLASQRGQIMRRNSCANPWQNFLNVSLRQSLPSVGGNVLTLELGIFNLLNLLNSEWGQIKSVGGGVFNEVTMLSAQTANAGAGEPPLVYQFDQTQVTERFRTTTSLGNSYQVQLALRYAF